MANGYWADSKCDASYGSICKITRGKNGFHLLHPLSNVIFINLSRLLWSKCYKITCITQGQPLIKEMCKTQFKICCLLCHLTHRPMLICSQASIHATSGNWHLSFRQYWGQLGTFWRKLLSLSTFRAPQSSRFKSSMPNTEEFVGFHSQRWRKSIHIFTYSAKFSPGTMDWVNS